MFSCNSIGSSTSRGQTSFSLTLDNCHVTFCYCKCYTDRSCHLTWSATSTFNSMHPAVNHTSLYHLFWNSLNRSRKRARKRPDFNKPSPRLAFIFCLFVCCCTSNVHAHCSFCASGLVFEVHVYYTTVMMKKMKKSILYTCVFLTCQCFLFVGIGLFWALFELGSKTADFANFSQ